MSTQHTYSVIPSIDKGEKQCNWSSYPFPSVLNFILLFKCIYFNWRLITLQYCSGFCHTLTWISHGFTCVPHPEPHKSSVQFSRSVVSDSLRPHESQHARPPCPSPAPRVHSDSLPSSQWCYPAISSLVFPFFSCPQSLPASKSFPVSQL